LAALLHRLQGGRVRRSKQNRLGGTPGKNKSQEEAGKHKQPATRRYESQTQAVKPTTNQTKQTSNIFKHRRDMCAMFARHPACESQMVPQRGLVTRCLNREKERDGE